MSSGSSDIDQRLALSMVAQFDDINRLNNVLNDEYSEQCKYYPINNNLVYLLLLY